MTQRQFATPVLIRGSKELDRKARAVSLDRVPFAEGPFDEDWLQCLLFDHPTLVPAKEIEPVCDNMVPVGREVPTAVGPIDLLYVNSKGFIAIVETKLWRNPEARRSVVAQIIDYAKAMSLWSYEDLDKAVRKAKTNQQARPLLEIVRESSPEEPDEKQFVDQLAQNLRRGRFLLLIVGDGIQEGVEQMAEFLQQTPQLAFSLALVEMAMFRENTQTDELLFVQPRIVGRTREVTRAIIEIKAPISPSDVTVAIPADEPGGRERKPITEDVFIETLRENSSRQVVEFARWVLQNAEKHDLTLDWMEAGPVLKYEDETSDDFFNLGQLSRDGRLTGLLHLYIKFERRHLPMDICKDYFDALASLIPGAARRPLRRKGGAIWCETVLVGNDPTKADVPSLDALAPHKEKWFEIIDKTVARIREAVAAKAGHP